MEKPKDVWSDEADVQRVSHGKFVSSRLVHAATSALRPVEPTTRNQPAYEMRTTYSLEAATKVKNLRIEP
jgi:hypothetical protein